MIALWVFVAAACFGGIFVAILHSRQKAAQERLDQIVKGSVLEDEEDLEEEKLKLSQRLWSKAAPRLERVSRRYTPSGYLEHIKLLLTRAGRSESPHTFIAGQMAMGVGAILLAAWTSSIGISFIIPLFILVAGLLLPYRRLKSSVEKRQEAIEQELPNFLDLLTVLVETGTSLDVAVQRIAKHQQSVLTDLFMEAQRDVQWGRSTRPEAFKWIADSTGVVDLERLIIAIIGAEARGTDLAPVLRRQSQELHRERSYRVNKLAQELAVKIMGPLFVCFLPVMFLLVIYPVGVQIMDAMG